MSTRAFYTFKGETAADTWNVYKHSDGYPTGAANVLKTAIQWFAWKLPRYEADEFAAAFIAAGKSPWMWDSKFSAPTLKKYGPKGEYESWRGGGVRMMPQGDPLEVAKQHCADIEYRYEIARGNDSGIRVRAYSVSIPWDKADGPAHEELLMDCPIEEFEERAKAAREAAE